MEKEDNSIPADPNVRNFSFCLVDGNCDEFLYLGGNETGTHKMIAESYLGKQTIDMNTYGKSSGRSGNYSTNWQITGRELLDAAEVRMLDNRYALLFIRGEMPVMDEKYDLLNHPNVKFTPEKGGAPYVHGGTELSVGSPLRIRSAFPVGCPRLWMTKPLPVFRRFSPVESATDGKKANETIC